MSKVYHCNYCIYSTKDSSNYKKHLMSKRHKVQIRNKSDLHKVSTKIVGVKKSTGKVDLSIMSNQCEHCLKIFSRPDSLKRHANSCLSKCLDKKDTIINNQKEKLAEKDEQINYYKQLMEAKGIKENNVDKYTYIVAKYPDAPPMETLTFDVFKKHHVVGYVEDSNKSYNDHMVEGMLHEFHRGKIPEYVTKTMTKILKKKEKDKKYQQIWVTDPSRLRFLIKIKKDPKSASGSNSNSGSDYEAEHNESFWKVDCGGQEVLDKIVRPVLVEMDDAINLYMEEHYFSSDEENGEDTDSDDKELEIEADSDDDEDEESSEYYGSDDEEDSSVECDSVLEMYLNEDVSESSKKAQSRKVGNKKKGGEYDMGRVQDLMQLKNNMTTGMYDRDILRCMAPNFIIKKKKKKKKGKGKSKEKGKKRSKKKSKKKLKKNRWEN